MRGGLGHLVRTQRDAAEDHVGIVNELTRRIVVMTLPNLAQDVVGEAAGLLEVASFNGRSRSDAHRVEMPFGVRAGTFDGDLRLLELLLRPEHAFVSGLCVSRSRVVELAERARGAE